MSKSILLSRIRSLVGGVAIAVLAAACASQPEPAPPAPAPEVVPAAPVAEAPAPAPRASAPARTATAAGSDIPLNPRHPTRYVVKRGDTLWDISEMFLEDPWYWPEIWYVNPQVANPHLIYPGDVLALVYIDGRPRIILEQGGATRLSPRVRREPLAEAIPTIPTPGQRPGSARPHPA